MIVIIFGVMMSINMTIHKEVRVKILEVKEQRSLKILIKSPNR